ncbi:MAG: flavin reductase family protein [Candidatus Zixiibacteriota bacterium]
MAKVKLAGGAFNYPKPIVLVGATVDGRPNFLTVGWMSRVDLAPAYLAIAIGRERYTTRGVEEHGTFSVNLPGRGLVAPTDYVGLNSGEEVEKAGVFDVFYGELETAPMIGECPLCVECRVIQKVELHHVNLYVGEEVAAYADESIVVAGEPDIIKADSFLLAMPAKKYVTVGDAFADAYSIGREYKAE